MTEITIKEPGYEEAEQLAAVLCNDSVLRCELGFEEQDRPTTEDVLQKLAEWGPPRRATTYAILANDTTVGSISLSHRSPDGLSAQIGYWVGSAHRRLGYCTRAFLAVLDRAVFEGIATVSAKIACDNLPSRRLWKRQGAVASEISPGWLQYELRIGSRSVGAGDTLKDIDQTTLKHRFELRKSKFISERFEKSPNITEQYDVSDHLRICYGLRDEAILPFVGESFSRAYIFVKDWFGHNDNVAFDLWMAPELIDLQYMTCLSCNDTSFFAPGDRDGRHIMLFVSPLRCSLMSCEERLPGLLAHEISHHMIREISQATSLSMKRKEKQDVPMWLEEGLCQYIDGEISSSIDGVHVGKVTGIEKRYDIHELWNDLSSCEEPDIAYLQAYEATRSVLATKGKAEIIRLLYLNRTHGTDWEQVL
jgi:RimJ/RimL family protein N-acetyltransferase